jgi:hypothetical protein
MAYKKRAARNSATGGDGNHYVKPSKLTELLLTYQRTGCPVTLDAIIKECLYPISLGMVSKKRYKLIDPEDAVQECVMQCLKQIARYNLNHQTVNDHSTGDPDRKAFAFFSTCASNTINGLYRREKAQVIGKKAVFTHLVEVERRGGDRATRKTMAEVASGYDPEA